MLFGEIQLGHRLEDFLQISLHVLHHDEDIVEIIRVLWGNNVKDLGSEAVVLHLSKLAKDLDLAHDFFEVVFILEDVVD